MYFINVHLFLPYSVSLLKQKGSNFQVDTNLLDKDLFTKLKANLKNSSGIGYTPAYTSDR